MRTDRRVESSEVMALRRGPARARRMVAGVVVGAWVLLSASACTPTLQTQTGALRMGNESGEPTGTYCSPVDPDYAQVGMASVAENASKDDLHVIKVELVNAHGLRATEGVISPVIGLEVWKDGKDLDTELHSGVDALASLDSRVLKPGESVTVGTRAVIDDPARGGTADGLAVTYTRGEGGTHFVVRGGLQYEFRPGSCDTGEDQ